MKTIKGNFDLERVTKQVSRLMKDYNMDAISFIKDGNEIEVYFYADANMDFESCPDCHN